jgi:uncharacterized membrane protein
MTTKTEISAVTLAAALALLAGSASAQMTQDEKMKEMMQGGGMAGKEKCYGIALKGENDCASKGVNSCAGQSKADYEGTAWKLVAKGTCETIKTPHGMGSLKPTKS